jgi:regulator of sirC expression with transglutaminase-like and TPR domain
MLNHHFLFHFPVKTARFLFHFPVVPVSFPGIFLFRFPVAAVSFPGIFLFRFPVVRFKLKANDASISLNHRKRGTDTP